MLPAASRWPLRLLCWVLVGLGIVQRTLPLLDVEGRIARQFPTEDGYLMLTIARNLALGHGMSTAAGTIPTNGTQPLATFVYALGFWLVDGDKVRGVALAQLWGLLVAAATALALRRFGRWLLRDSDPAGSAAALAAAVWFASPLLVGHSMNCLETGLYGLLVLACAAWFAARMQDPAQPWPLAACLRFGGMLGVAFWARNDACLLILVVCVLRLVGGPWSGWAARLREVVVVGAASVLVASPWLLSNALRFGHIVPISGIAESLTAGFATNLPWVPAPLLEYVLLPLQVPVALEDSNAVQVVAAALLGAAGTVAARAWAQARGGVRATIAVAGGFALTLVGFYGLYFGAFWFLSRYLMPLSPLLALGWAWAVLSLLARARAHLAARAPRLARLARLARLGPALGPALGVLLCAAIAAGAARVYRGGTNQGHFQVVSWVEQHVDDATWVAATQTGTLGFFHDRTINLDGKVNPQALRARQERGHVIDYLLASPVEVLADWRGLEDWLPRLAGHFERRVVDRELNLAVLQRVH